MEPNLIILHELTNSNLIKAIERNYYCDYFNFLTPCVVKDNQIYLCLNEKVRQIYEELGWEISYDSNSLIKING